MAFVLPSGTTAIPKIVDDGEMATVPKIVLASTFISNHLVFLDKHQMLRGGFTDVFRGHSQCVANIFLSVYLSTID